MSGPRLFLDTGFVLALLNRADQYHDRARAWAAYLPRVAGLWTTEAVLTEIGNGCSALRRQAAVDFIRQLYRAPAARVVTVDTDLLGRALELYEDRPDKTWGLTDCISFVVMGDNAVAEALTPDHHFEQAGFVALLLQDPPP